MHKTSPTLEEIQNFEGKYPKQLWYLFLLLTTAFYCFGCALYFVDTNGISLLNIFTLTYLIITFGELCLSPIGLFIITKLWAGRLHGMMKGISCLV